MAAPVWRGTRPTVAPEADLDEVPTKPILAPRTIKPGPRHVDSRLTTAARAWARRIDMVLAAIEGRRLAENDREAGLVDHDPQLGLPPAWQEMD